jgi:hypothetical protein
MSIFRESFPGFVIDELDRRQDGMFARTPKFLHELNTRSAWVRMTSGVNTEDSNKLATQYVLQGGTLLNNTSLRKGLGGNATSTYDRLSPGGSPNRLGIRPMPGITNVTVNSKGAYGSLQEATVNFIAWDIRQLEDLELLYMRPGYTVLLEFGWNYIKPTIPQYDILNKSEISLNDAFAEIYKLIEKSNGNYDALLGYVKNYNWSARDDGGYDCSTTIISLGEVLESLKCNWIPMETVAFTNSGILGGAKTSNGGTLAPNGTYPDSTGWTPTNYYEQGIIPGLLAELFRYMDNITPGIASYSSEVTDPKYGNKYQLFMIKRSKGDLDKFNRGGLPRYITDRKNVEGYITLGSFCDLLNNYVLLKDIKDNPLSRVTAYELDASGNILTEKLSNGATVPKSLRCIASPLSLSTNYGICVVRNNNWGGLSATVTQNEAQQDEEETGPPATEVIRDDIRADITTSRGGGLLLNQKTFNSTKLRFRNNISETNGVYRFNGDVEETLKQVVTDLTNAIVDVKLEKTSNGLIPRFIFLDKNGTNSFLSKTTNPTQFVDFLDYFYLYNRTERSQEDKIKDILLDFFPTSTGRNTLFDIGGEKIYDSKREWSKEQITTTVKNLFTKAPLSQRIQTLLNQQTEVAAANVAEVAADVPGLTSAILPFLVQDTTETGKSLGYISNIYVNMEFLVDQAISKNVASNDAQGKNTIAIREYIQNILRQIQNSIGSINSFDIQVDERNAVGRVIDINFTGDPSLDAFELQIHNLNSIVRKYSFSSKIFPEMGSIIAISAQDPSGIGKMGYDNATLVAWNNGVKDRLIPKKDFSSAISLEDTQSPGSFILPFLTKIYAYFSALEGEGKNNANLSYGGLDFAYRDFLANLNRFDPQNTFKAIIPTELSVELDGIGGIVIGNIFTINQDIVPKGYQSVSGRQLGYLVGKLGHSVSNNDWVTNIQAYPIILETSVTDPVWKKWNNQEYTNSPNNVVLKGADGKPIASAPLLDGKIPKNSNIPVVKYLRGLGYKNGEVPNTSKSGEILLRNLKLSDDSQSNNIHQLFPAAATQWEKLVAEARKAGYSVGQFNISYLPGAAYRSLQRQQATEIENPGAAAKAGTSIHGWGTAVDIQQLYTAVGGSTNPLINANIRNNNSLYKWLDANAARFGWINPPKLKDGVKVDEAWHWEYWGPISGGAIGASESTGTSSSTVSPQYIADLIRGAASGAGTNEQGLIDAINSIKDKNTFAEVNRIVNIQNILNEELGSGDRATTNTIKAKLATLGITLTYTPIGTSGGSEGVRDIKIVF